LPIKLMRDSPYPGLRPFAVEDADFFFGRDSETRVISANLRTRRLTLLYGPSGVGKSSVLQAGVINHLYELDAQLQLDQVELDDDCEQPTSTGNGSNVPDEGGSRKPSTSIVVVKFENWREKPHSFLKDAILAALEESLPKIFTTAKNNELRQLALREMLLEITKSRHVMELLIILDQFEQYFVYHSVNDEPGNFGGEFCRAVSSRELGANFLVSIREDWLASLDHFTERVPDFLANSIRIEHMDRKSAASAIREPIRKYNDEIREHHGEPGFSRQEVVLEEPSFIDEALNQLERLDLEHEDSDNLGSTQVRNQRKPRIQASGLQIVLRHLWNKVKNDSPPTFSTKLLPAKEAKRIFRWHLDESLRDLGFFEKRTAEKLFPLLVTSSGTKLADTASSLAERSGCNPDKVRDLITKLVNTKILNQHGPLSPRAPLLFYEITSDVMAAPIRNWLKDRRLRRRRVGQAGFAVGGILVFILAGIGLTLLFQSRLRSEAEQKRLKRAYRLQQWENIRHLAAAGDKQIPYLKVVLRGHEAEVTSAILTSEGQIFTASADGSAMLWDPETGDPIRVFGGDDVKPITCAAINSDGNLIVTANTDGTVWLWGRGYSIPLAGIQLRGEVGKHVTGVSFSPNGELIAAANTAGDLLIWNSKTQELIANRPGNGAAARHISFSSFGKWLGTASNDSTAKVWQTGDWREPMVLSGHTGRINGLAFSPDERYLATAGADATVRLWDLKTGQSRGLMGHAASVNSVDFDSSGEHILSASDDGTARIWRVDNTTFIELKGHKDKVLSASFSPNGLQVVTASRDNTARIWSTHSGNLLEELQGHSSEVTYVSYSKDGKYVLTASDDATARLWIAPESERFEIETPVIKTMKPYSEYVGPCPVTVGFDVSIKVIKGAGSVIYRFKGSDGRIWPPQQLVFDGPDTKYLKWYWRITENYQGAETIEIIEPKGIKDQEASFKVTCTAGGAPPEPSLRTGPNPGGSPTPPSTAPSPPASPAPSPPGH
jgi:WD40 repeat protein